LSGPGVAASRTLEAVPKEIEVTRVASGLVDHVHNNPAHVDRTDPE
jgi:hypothetical protein